LGEKVTRQLGCQGSQGLGAVPLILDGECGGQALGECVCFFLTRQVRCQDSQGLGGVQLILDGECGGQTLGEDVCFFLTR
jgi:hypothetical protein